MCVCVCMKYSLKLLSVGLLRSSAGENRFYYAEIMKDDKVANGNGMGSPVSFNH